MGPPEFTGGNLVVQPQSTLPTDVLQWGRRNSPAETRLAKLPIGRFLPCFNGAAGIHRRKRPHCRIAGRTRPAASMGPPEFTGGNRFLTCRSVLNSLSFNGAAGIHRRKLTRQLSSACQQDLLQWGRRNSPAETSVESARRLHALVASMGPPEFTGGNPRNSPRSTGWVKGLQWGRRNSPAETQLFARTKQPALCQASMGPPEFTGGNGRVRRQRQPGGRRASMGPPEFTGGNVFMPGLAQAVVDLLQWGRRNSPAETSAGAAGWTLVEVASMGPPEFTGGNTLSVLFPSCRQFEASMGPPEFTGGNAVVGHVQRSPPTLLQWGRRNSPAETVPRLPRARAVPARFNGAAGIHRRKPPSYQVMGMVWAGRFNGAAGIHRRKHLREVGLPQGRLHASMGPPEFTGGNVSRLLGDAVAVGRLQWGRRNSPAETAIGGRRFPVGMSCFNGAAGIHRRKPPHDAVERRVRHSASMGPPEFTGGNAIWQRCARRSSGRLQWGRRNSPAETLHADLQYGEWREASMGPPEFTGGNPP